MTRMKNTQTRTQATGKPFAQGARFLEDPEMVAACIAADDVLWAIATVLMAQRDGFVATRARAYLVHRGTIAVLDCEIPWLWVAWGEDMARELGWSQPLVVADLKPWRGTFTVPDHRPDPTLKPAPRSETPPIPLWWRGEGAPPVRCADCIHSPTRHHYCDTARRRVGAAHLWRRCQAFESRTTPPPEPPPPRAESPVETAPAPEAPRVPEHPVTRLRAILAAHGLGHALADVREIERGQIAVRLAPTLTDDESQDALYLIGAALRTDR